VDIALKDLVALAQAHGLPGLGMILGAYLLIRLGRWCSNVVVIPLRDGLLRFLDKLGLASTTQARAIKRLAKGQERGELRADQRHTEVMTALRPGEDEQRRPFVPKVEALDYGEDR